MGEADAQLALDKLTAILEAEGLPYAIIGAFALNEYGHRRTVSPGVGVGPGGEGFVRFALVETDERARQACAAIGKSSARDVKLPARVRR